MNTLTKDSLPCKGAKFILQRLKSKYNLEIRAIYINANNKNTIYEKYNLDNTKIPSVFIDDKLIGYGKIEESDIREEIEKILSV
jgi:hypothetical protein